MKLSKILRRWINNSVTLREKLKCIAEERACADMCLRKYLEKDGWSTCVLDRTDTHIEISGSILLHVGKRSIGCVDTYSFHVEIHLSDNEAKVKLEMLYSSMLKKSINFKGRVDNNDGRRLARRISNKTLALLDTNNKIKELKGNGIS